MPARKLRILPGNRLVLKYGLYAACYPGSLFKALACIPPDDLTGEILNVRAAQARLTHVLYNEPDLEPRDVTALARAIAFTTAVIAHVAEVQRKLDRPPEPLSLAWDLSLVQLSFFDEKMNLK